MNGHFVMPPEEMRVRVSGCADPAYFTGLTLATFLDMLPFAYKPGHPGNTKWNTILDFGCGPGRVTQWLAFNPYWKVYGCDIDAEAIKWDIENIPNASFACVQPEPKLPYTDQMFDLIIASSVFSHIPHQLIEPWLIELRRVMTDNATLVFSFHGPSEQPEATNSAKSYPDSTCIPGVASESYVSTYCSDKWLLGICEKHFKVKGYKARGFCGHQDIVAVSRV